MGRSALLLGAAIAVVAAGASPARADVVVIRGIELQLPANWVMQNKASYTTLRPKASKGRAVQVISLAAMPPAKPGEIPVGEEGKLVIPQVRELERDGITLVAATGKLVQKNVELAVDLLAIPVGGKAVMLMSYVGADQDPLIRQHNTKILLSARVPGPRMTITFEAPKRAGAIGLSEGLVKDLTGVIQIFDRSYRLPRPLPVAIKDCNTPNAFYSPKGHSITLCHELYAYFLDIFKKGGVADDKLSAMAERAYLFTFLHEFGHALVGELELPITGRGEDAADEYATLQLAAGGARGHGAALAGARWFDITRKQPGHKNTFYDTHSFDEQRLVSITCLLYGKDQKAYADLMKSLQIPASRLAKCQRDYPLRLKAWNGMLAPYIIKRPAKT